MLLRFSKLGLFMDSVSQYGKNVYFVSKKLDISIRRLSKITGIKYQTIQQLVSGKQRTTEAETALRLAEALKVSPATLVRDNLQKQDNY
jgi:plasmid maintenance system antidote protein VapI